MTKQERMTLNIPIQFPVTQCPHCEAYYAVLAIFRCEHKDPNWIFMDGRQLFCPLCGEPYSDSVRR